MDDWATLLGEFNEAKNVAVKEEELGTHIDIDEAIRAANDKQLGESMQLTVSEPDKIVPIEKKRKTEQKRIFTDEEKRDWEALRMRSVYVEGGRNMAELEEEPPESLQFGVVQTHARYGRNMRLKRRERAPTIAEALTRDEGVREFLEKNRKKLLNREREAILGRK